MEILDIIKEAKQVYGDKAKEVIVNEWPLEAYDGKNKARSPFNSDTTASCMWNQKELCWKDFSSGRVIGILDLFQHKYGDTYKEAIVRLCEETGVTLPDDGNWTGYNKGELLPKNYRYPYITEQSFNNRKDVEEYLGKRGLSIATLDHFGIKEDEHKNIVFEFFDADNMLLSVKLRPSHRIRPSEPKMFWQNGSDNCPLLFNVNRVNFEQPLVITEGNIDAMSVFEAGYYNVVSIPGGVQDTKWIEFNYKFLENFSQFIVWTDNDEAGQQGRQKIVKRLGEYNCKIVTPTDDVLDVIESYYQQYDANSHIRKADANNVLIACGGGMILNLLKTAKEIENPKVKRLMDYDEQQLQDLPRISTGFKAIDRVMYGNFENSLTVLTGKAGCVDCDTEFFNGHEWKRIADFKQGDKVLQYNDDGTAELVSPLVYVKSPCDKLWHFKTKYGLDQCLSDDHNVYYQTSKGNSTMKKFGEIRKMHESNKQGFSGRFYRTFNYDGHGINLTDAEIELMCAVICDGSFYYDNRDGDYSNRPSNDTCRFHIKKDRKKVNLRFIFKKCSLEYREVESADDGYTDFYVTPPRHEKYFSDFWYGCNNRQLNIICDNVLFWDGHCDRDGRRSFSTTVKESADFVQFAFSATGRSATIYTDNRSGQKYQTNGKEYIRKSDYYDVRISDRKMSGMTGKNGGKTKIEEYATKDGFMYCFTVPSHKWVMRRNNKIVVTGNSGKSTWLNQFFIAEPLEAGERVLIYSGELPARILLGNILRPLASRRHIIELDNGEDQPKGYKVTTEASKAIKSYYRDNLFVFDDLDELETSGGGLLEAMEYSYKRYGITSYVIDNLMTVDMRGVDGESKIDRQIQFVKRLKKFTREYPVKVLLVAHARKLASGQAETGLDDISGASEIVKLCDRCYDVKVVHNDDTEDALAPSTKISVIKDRQAGRVGAKFELYFDECSSRIYTDEPERDKQYAWERDLWRQKKEIQYPEVIKSHIVANLPDRAVSVKVETADGEKPDDMPF